jgi:predicted transcriptional regulator
MKKLGFYIRETRLNCSPFPLNEKQLNFQAAQVVSAAVKRGELPQKEVPSMVLKIVKTIKSQDKSFTAHN